MCIPWCSGPSDCGLDDGKASSTRNVRKLPLQMENDRSSQRTSHIRRAHGSEMWRVVIGKYPAHCRSMITHDAVKSEDFLKKSTEMKRRTHRNEWRSTWMAC